jgi:hypothetical protein
MDADAAKHGAIEHCLFHYPTLYTAGVPRRNAQLAANVWVVPIMLEDPEAGISDPVGELSIDAETRAVVTCTPAAEILAAGKRLYEGTAPCRWTR